MVPSTIRAAIVGAMKTRYPTLTVEAHGGMFTESELALVLAKAPALLVSCTGFRQLAPGPTAAQWKATLRWGLVVVGADTASTDRDVLALDTVFDLLLWLPDQRWGLSGAKLLDPETLTADNLYTGQINLLRVALWGLTWTQDFQTLYP
jgi:phage gp37-like protein